MRRLHALPVADLAALRRVDSAVVDAVDAYLADARPHLGSDAPPVLVHSELAPAHVLVDDVDGAPAITGVIDFGDAVVAPAGLELPAVAVLATSRVPADGAAARGRGLVRVARGSVGAGGRHDRPRRR